MPDVQSDAKVETAPLRGRDDGVNPGPVLIIRPRIALRVAGPTLFAVGALSLAADFLAGGVLVLAGLALLVAWIPRIEADATEIRIRRLRGSEAIPLATVDEIRLRRVPFGPPRPVRRNYRIGRFCTTPIRFRIICKEITLVQITVVWWDHWPKLVRYVLSLPNVGSDGRTRGRLDRYG